MDLVNITKVEENESKYVFKLVPFKKLKNTCTLCKILMNSYKIKVLNRHSFFFHRLNKLKFFNKKERSYHSIIILLKWKIVY
jgi:hypothetical protein